MPKSCTGDRHQVRALMIALLPRGVAKPLDEHLPQGADHAKANLLRQEGPPEIQPGRMMRFQFSWAGGDWGTIAAWHGFPP